MRNILLLVIPAMLAAGAEAAVKPKPLSHHVKRGLAFLVEMQNADGGWSQGEESSAMRGRPADVRDVSNVADTAAAALALIRADSTPSKGEYAKNIRRAVEFVCGEVEKSDVDSLAVTQIRGTRLQAKLGPYIDTFLASLLLAEVKGQMPDPASERRVNAALNKVLAKIEKNQREDGTWDNRGWAPTLAQAMGAKAINRAAQAGAPVSESIRGRTESYAQGQFNEQTGTFSAAGAAGVDLYSSAANLGAMRDSENTNLELEKTALDKLKTAATADERRRAEADLARIEQNRRQLKLAEQAVVAKMNDPRFIAGFGSNGGEEFLSYMNIGESLVATGGQAWEEWDRAMTKNLNSIQNNDGSWTGHHCITGRTFCTASALLVLMVDRAPVPVAGKFSRR